MIRWKWAVTSGKTWKRTNFMGSISHDGSVCMVDWCYHEWGILMVNVTIWHTWILWVFKFSDERSWHFARPNSHVQPINRLLLGARSTGRPGCFPIRTRAGGGDGATPWTRSTLRRSGSWKPGEFWWDFTIEHWKTHQKSHKWFMINNIINIINHWLFHHMLILLYWPLLSHCMEKYIPDANQTVLEYFSLQNWDTTLGFQCR